MVGKESEARKETNKLGENEWVIGLEILMRLIICIEKLCKIQKDKNL